MEKAAKKAKKLASRVQGALAPSKLDVYGGVRVPQSVTPAAQPDTSAPAQMPPHTAQVSASVTLKPQLMVTLRDIQNLVLWVLGEGDNPKWIFVKARAQRTGLERQRGRHALTDACACRTSPWSRRWCW